MTSHSYFSQPNLVFLTRLCLTNNRNAEQKLWANICRSEALRHRTANASSNLCIVCEECGFEQDVVYLPKADRTRCWVEDARKERVSHHKTDSETAAIMFDLKIFVEVLIRERIWKKNAKQHSVPVNSATCLCEATGFPLCAFETRLRQSFMSAGQKVKWYAAQTLYLSVGVSGPGGVEVEAERGGRGGFSSSPSKSYRNI